MYAWCHVDEDGKRVATGAGLYAVVRDGVHLPPNAEEWAGWTVSNNLMELMALVRGLEALPDDWCGTVNSDSSYALGILFRGWKLGDHIPHWIRERMGRALRRLGAECTPRLLDGLHIRPTTRKTSKDYLALELGVGKRGNPVSEHNAWCDLACFDAGRVYWEAIRDLPATKVELEHLQAAKAAYRSANAV